MIVNNKISSFLVAAVLLCSGCNSGTESKSERAVAPSDVETQWRGNFFRCDSRTLDWQQINDWFYQLQYVDYEKLAESQYDLVVIDGEPPQNPPNRNLIERLKCGGDTSSDSEKLVVSYITIGQAENYRYYWQPDWQVGNPDWIVLADAYWPGDFYVRYWVQEWRDILMGSPNSRIDRLLEAGFDGLYLDIIDAYELFIDENPNAREEMRLLIADIAAYARQKTGNPNFGIFVQNAEELIATVGPVWVEPLTGIGKEEPFFWATDDRVADESRYWNDLYLGQWVDAGKLVINVDYVTKKANIDEVYRLGKEKGYVPLAIGDKLLDKLIFNEGHEPD